MKILRNDFYKLLVNILNKIEKEHYICITSIERKQKYLDVNEIRITTSFNYHVINEKGFICFSEEVKKSEYTNYIYYTSEVIDLKTDIMKYEDMCSLLTQGIVNYDYLVLLLDILKNMFDERKMEVLKLSKEDIDIITSKVQRFNDELLEIKKQLGIIRKRDQN